MTKIVKAPVSFDGYITKDREYYINKTAVLDCYKMIDDKGEYIYIRLLNCSHLGGRDWIVVK